VLALETGLLAFSQTMAGYRDEGLHLLAAQLVDIGRRPYLDFFFQHTPLFTYLNAACLRIFGPSWRAPHALAALLTGAAILLVADFVYSRLRAPAWRPAGAITAALLMGLNTLVIRFGTISQPYAPCLFFGAASFRLTVEAAEASTGLVSFWAGIGAGAAVASSLLAVPMGPILLVWLIWRTSGADRLKKCLQFLAGGVIPFLPLLWLAAQGPRQVLFDVTEFHLFYRGLAFLPSSGLFRWDLGVVTGWLHSTQGLVLAGLGALCIVAASDWEERQRAELYLCAWLTVGLGLYIAAAHPTFEQYFVLLAPFLSITAALGLYAIGSRLWPARHPAWLALALAGLFCLQTYQQRGLLYPCWRQIEAVAQAINQVAPQKGEVYADYESVYFAAGRLPPSGLENSFAPVLRLPPAFAARLHVVPQSQVDGWLAGGRFAAVLVRASDPDVQSLGLRRLYSRQREITCYNERHYLFWDRVSLPE